MSLADVGIIVGFITGAMSLLASIIYSTVRIAKLELKVDTMWSFQLRRGFGEALEGGLMEKNSPIKLTLKAHKAFEIIQNELRTFYKKFGINMTDAELALSIERRYGNRIVEEICIPLGIRDAACLIIATAIAKGIDTLSIADSYPEHSSHS